MILSQRFFLSIFLFILTETCLAAAAGVNWQWANPKPQGGSFNAAVYNSTMGASSDGAVNWAVQNSNTTNNLDAIYKEISS